MAEDKSLAPMEATAPAVVSSPEMLIAKAIETGISVEGLERLLAMREKLKAEEARTAFLRALSDFQNDCPVIPKTKVVQVRSASGGSYSYHYAVLEDIVNVVSPILHRYGLSYSFDTRFESEPPAQVVTCSIYHEAGHSETSEFRTPLDAGARMNDMQKAASAQTYAKRYAFCNALGILTGEEDDDGRGQDKPASPPPDNRHDQGGYGPTPRITRPVVVNREMPEILASVKNHNIENLIRHYMTAIKTWQMEKKGFLNPDKALIQHQVREALDKLSMDECECEYVLTDDAQKEHLLKQLISTAGNIGLKIE